MQTLDHIWEERHKMVPILFLKGPQHGNVSSKADPNAQQIVNVKVDENYQPGYI